MADPHRVYNQQKSNAKRRKIAWRLTFDEWWNLWEISGKWKRRGKHSGQYCMARPGDRGPYTVGNVRIVTVHQNHKEMTYEHTDAAKEKISRFHKGKQHWLGKKHTEATKRKMGRAQEGNTNWLGKHHSEATKAFKRKHWRNQYGYSPQEDDNG